MADTFEIEIATPEKLVAQQRAETAQIPGKDGYMGVLPGHAPLLSELGVGQQRGDGHQKSKKKRVRA